MSNREEEALEEVKAMGTEGLNENCMAAIADLAENEDGASIFLFISLNQRIAKLEKAIASLTNWDFHASKEDGIH